MNRSATNNASLLEIAENEVVDIPLPPPGKVGHGAENVNDDDLTFCQDCVLTEDRIERARRTSSVVLTGKELEQLTDAQRHIAVAHEDDDNLAQLRRAAEAEERCRRGVSELRARMLDAARRARTDDDDGALGVPLMRASGNKLAKPAAYNSLLEIDGGSSLSEAVAKELLDDDDDDDDDDDYDDDEGEGCDANEDGGHDAGETCHDSLYDRRCNHMRQMVEEQCFDCTDITYVRKPNLAKLIKQRDKDAEEQDRPKFSLRGVLTSRRFHLYKHRFANAQYKRELAYPTLPQPKEGRESGTEMTRTRSRGHRFVIAADTQFGILMDGYAMDNPNWNDEIELSRRCVEHINAMTGRDRPLFVCVCGDLVDTESSFSRALASWKKVMAGWERTVVFDQQVKDFKRVWGRLDDDIALVCLCGNHDVGNRPTADSIERWTSSFGDDYLAFWANGTYNIALNNCLFSDPTGAPELFEKQLVWLEQRLIHANENDATHIFVYSHFPWFLRHEDETDEEVSSFSDAPPGWGPSGTRFPDSYFTIPIEERQMALMLFRKYGVTACFSGHFHQNVVAKANWGMDMIVTGPLSMTLRSTIHESLSDEPHGIGMRVVDVGDKGEFKHQFVPLNSSSFGNLINRLS